MIRLVVLAGALVLAGTAAAIPLPEPLETAHLLGPGLPAGKPPVGLQDEFYALAWGRDQTLAYLERRSMGGAATARLRVLDLVEDRVLFERSWPAWDTDESRRPWWADRAGEVEAIVERFGLRAVDQQLGQFPLILDNEYYSVVLRAHRDPRNGGWIDRLETLVHSTGRGLKLVEDLPGAWRWASILGFLPSPFENRLALVLVVQPAGWDQELQPLRYLVVGLSLKAGFPKP